MSLTPLLQANQVKRFYENSSKKQTKKTADLKLAQDHVSVCNIFFDCLWLLGFKV